MVVDRGDIGPRDAADVAHRDLLEAAIGEQPLRRLQQPLAGLGVARAGHSERLNSAVAALSDTTEKISRNIRS